MSSCQLELFPKLQTLRLPGFRRTVGGQGDGATAANSVDLMKGLLLLASQDLGGDSGGYLHLTNSAFLGLLQLRSNEPRSGDTFVGTPSSAVVSEQWASLSHVDVGCGV